MVWLALCFVAFVVFFWTFVKVMKYVFDESLVAQALPKIFREGEPFGVVELQERLKQVRVKVSLKRLEFILFWLGLRGRVRKKMTEIGECFMFVK